MASCSCRIGSSLQYLLMITRYFTRSFVENYVCMYVCVCVFVCSVGVFLFLKAYVQRKRYRPITSLHSITFSIGSSTHQNRRALDMHPRKILVDYVKSQTLPYDMKEVHRCTVLRRFEDKVAVLFRNKIEPETHVLFEARSDAVSSISSGDSDTIA